MIGVQRTSTIMTSVNSFFFFNDTATTEIYTLSLHDALPISVREGRGDPRRPARARRGVGRCAGRLSACQGLRARRADRSEEHTSELQSRQYLVCRLLLEKKKNQLIPSHRIYRTPDYL